MINTIGNLVLPLMILGIVGFGLIKGVKVYECFTTGAKNGLKTLYEIMPNIVALVLAVTLLEASGGMDFIGKVFSPLAKLFGVPNEVATMAAISPISGGGSMTVFESILSKYGPDSFEGRVASVIMGSTDTTLYAVTVYYGAIGIKKTKHTLYAGFCADFMSFAISAMFVRLTLSAC